MAEWFVEKLNMAQHIKTQISIKEKLYEEKSPYQHIAIYETTGFGKMLTLDDVIMCTEKDEFGYHEMIAHVPLFAHNNPENVLVIGGGDGGTVREVVKHSAVKHVDMCEIDERVVEVAKKYLPTMSNQLSNPKVSLHFQDGFQWVKDHKNQYDVIIVDSSDPVGPAEVLFKEEFIRCCYESLKENGILVNQAEHMLMFTDIIKEMLDYGRKYFPIQYYYNTLVPTYPGGFIGFTFFSKKFTPFENLAQRIEQEKIDNWNLQYYTKEMHKASFTLPKAIQKELKTPVISL
ncbi:MAG: polyamine aminopropyltransferase 2 [Leptospiraceae bacterium]|nr:MAG: polyamine aminopropyltransferase 2 [Leptospiraceae bacterium]